MPKYKLQLVKYTFPDAIKKYNDKLKLKETKNKRDEVQKQLKELEANHKNKTDNLSEEEYEEQKNNLLSKISKFNNTIYEIKAELNNSTVNFNNANIKELNTNISDVSSLINNNKKFNSKIASQISDLLTSQLKLNDIFKTKNFKDMLKEIVEEVSKTQNEEVKNKIEEVIQEINDNNNNANENYQAWVGIRDEIKKAIPDNLQNIIKKYGDDINKINELKSILYNIIFKKDIDNVSKEELEEYNYKFLLLSNLYDLVNKNLKDKYFRVDKPGKLTGLNTGFTNEDIYNIISNLRKWFSKDDYEDFNEDTFDQMLVSNISNDKLLNAKFVKDIDPVDIRNAVDFINNDIKRMKDNEKKPKQYQQKSLFRNKNEKQNDTQNDLPKNNKNELNENKSTQNENKAEGLDLDEIHNMNIMNGISANFESIIKSLDNIIYNQNRIIELLEQKQNYSQSSSQMKLGRFKAEKYKPNMSITEFKKLFDSKP